MRLEKMQKTIGALRECSDALTGMVKHVSAEVNALKKRLAPATASAPGYRTVDKAADDALAPASETAENVLARLAKQAAETPSLP